MPERFVNVKAAAEYLSVPVSTLYYWSHLGEGGPPVYRIGTRLRYRLSDLDRYIEAQRNEQAPAR